MKKILGLDLGTTSIGSAFVFEAENAQERSYIQKLGVRVNPLTVDEQTNFEKGKSITSNADRTLKRSMRRNLQRYKLRRDNLIEVLNLNGFIDDNVVLSEEGNFSTFNTYKLRAQAAKERIELADFARVLLIINKKRGYKSSRKAKGDDETGALVDSMDIAKHLYENNLTPGQYCLELLTSGKKHLPDFYRSDLKSELAQIIHFQKQFHSDFITDDLLKEIEGRGKQATSKFLLGKYKVYTADNKGTDKKLTAYQWRTDALSKQLSAEQVAYVITEVNGELNNSSGYLGSISDRSKELYFNKQTVGEYLYNQIKNNPHARLKGQVFYRQDYLDEFNDIWETQSKFHTLLNEELKTEIRDIIIFYQRRLKSQKGLISLCEFESRLVEKVVDGKNKQIRIGSRVCPKSSPLFQEFKIWQILNNLEVIHKISKEKRALYQEEKELLFEELAWVDSLKKAEVLKLFKNPKELELNYPSIEGNRTNAKIIEAFKQIVTLSGHEIDFSKNKASENLKIIGEIFNTLGIKISILSFHSSIEGKELERQDFYQLWQLLYSYEGDKSKTGNDALFLALENKFGIAKEYAKPLIAIAFQDDYGSLSAKVIKRILPHLKDGLSYDKACLLAGYNHSSSETKKEKENKSLKEKLEILPKNSLRNPVVEKILNQMVNVVNAYIDEYGKPDEIRIELARELKKSASEREEMTKQINSAKDNHEKYRRILQSEFGLSYVSRNDIIKYKLYRELEANGYKTLYTDTYISPSKLFSGDFDVEHIIPQSRLFDDSFANKTLETRSCNQEKGDKTAYDYIKDKYGDEGLAKYEERVNALFRAKTENTISKTKYNRLMMESSKIPTDFIQRDLRDSQYIAKKAKSMLEEVVRDVTTTTGMVTERLREDWQLVDVLQELNWEKYKALGLTYYEENRHGQKLPRIKDWNKRNDHRHHAMDALTVAFTKRSHVQYLNNLNARSDKSGSIYGIEQKELYRGEKGNLLFKPPIPLADFRAEAKHHLENVLVSFKAKNKVVTKNKNRYKTKNGEKTKIELTPRGQLHNETIYGSIQQYASKLEKVNASFTEETIMKVAKQKHREVLLNRLAENEGDAKKAFTGKNSLDKRPVYLDELQTQKLPEKVKLVWKETIYTTRKEISPDLKIEKVIDLNARKVLQARLTEYGNDAKKAFSNLEENPIWLNKEKGIAIKRVTITGINNAVALRSRNDKNGKPILDANGHPIPADFVNTGNNHHVAIYRDADGNLQDDIKSFFEAVTRINNRLDLIDKDKPNWDFLYTIKQNEYFVFPNPKTGFNPSEINLKDRKNYNQISPNLFRVQKISRLSYGNSVVREYVFRHHIETILNDSTELKDITYKNIKSLGHLENVIKVRINHLGDIIQVGEY
ncbi:type II CRISPR RNA-guided endonuclease Cas9 [Cytophagales bacterium LB-30]|uniref:CRISPR-associated endonuclease Cas9 n=1 Tax=Shiella aurantiaca TaxID=3058365 RepID=A0ABT8F827_9BACT|nr:type II CRISPR RNA-guided endonuclease Cas9 [Shiella aurantiaca]MDN4166376.1 type II CRISPR RNA-guided endonuclease Cas9 [Shiella aurantiaca]